MYFVVFGVKTLDEKRGVPLPGIPSVNEQKPKMKTVDKIKKADKLELLERRPSPLPSIQMSNDASFKMEKSEGMNCQVIIVMGMYCKPLNDCRLNFHLLLDVIKLIPCVKYT